MSEVKKDAEKGYLETYSALIPAHVDKRITDLARKTTPLYDLIPRAGEAKKAVPKTRYEQAKNKITKWFNNKRLKLAYWIGGKPLDDDMYKEDYY